MCVLGVLFAVVCVDPGDTVVFGVDTIRVGGVFVVVVEFVSASGFEGEGDVGEDGGCLMDPGEVEFLGLGCDRGFGWCGGEFAEEGECFFCGFLVSGGVDDGVVFDGLPGFCPRGGGFHACCLSFPKGDVKSNDNC